MSDDAKKSAALSASDPSLGGICRDRLYRASAIQKLAGGLGAAALRTLRRQGGMKIYSACGCTWILGSDFIDAVQQVSAKSESAQNTNQT